MAGEQFCLYFTANDFFRGLYLSFLIILSWGRERYVIESKLCHGMYSFGSMRGVSSHQHNPFAAVTLGTPDENTGEVRAFSFIYSGNFLVEAEYGELGRLRINIGIHPMGLQWNLKQGIRFS